MGWVQGVLASTFGPDAIIESESPSNCLRFGVTLNLLNVIEAAEQNKSRAESALGLPSVPS